LRGSHASKDGLKIRLAIIIGVATRTDGYLQIAGFHLSGCSVIHQKPDDGIVCLFTNRLQPGRILVCVCHAPGCTIIWVVFTGHGITHRLAGHVLDQEPGREQEREVNDGKQQHQEDGQSQGKLNHALRAAGILPKPFPGKQGCRVS
jgi:hypothetical protein